MSKDETYGRTKRPPGRTRFDSGVVESRFKILKSPLLSAMNFIQLYYIFPKDLFFQ